ncbi:MAG: VF530 family protein [Bdellovibrionota bacterium]
METRKKAPLEGITLERLLTELVDHYGWEFLGQEIRINCFNSDPSIKSSLTFLRRTPWARAKVEKLYLSYLASFQA